MIKQLFKALMIASVLIAVVIAISTAFLDLPAPTSHSAENQVPNVVSGGKRGAEKFINQSRGWAASALSRVRSERQDPPDPSPVLSVEVVQETRVSLSCDQSASHACMDLVNEAQQRRQEATQQIPVAASQCAGVADQKVTASVIPTGDIDAGNLNIEPTAEIK